MESSVHEGKMPEAMTRAAGSGSYMYQKEDQPVRAGLLSSA
jgi:hypothetical protein